MCYHVIPIYYVVMKIVCDKNGNKLACDAIILLKGILPFKLSVRKMYERKREKPNPKIMFCYECAIYTLAYFLKRTKNYHKKFNTGVCVEMSVSGEKFIVNTFIPFLNMM